MTLSIWDGRHRRRSILFLIEVLLSTDSKSWQMHARRANVENGKLEMKAPLLRRESIGDAK